MQVVSQIIFALALAAATYLFARNVGKIRRNINLGKPLDRTDNPSLRLKTMLRVAFGQSKMVVRPIPCINKY